MKKIYLLLLFVTCGMMAQIPQGFSYQAVALNSSGGAVASSPVKIRLSILESSATGTASYVELHNPSTNNVGLFTLTIGQGTPQTGSFNTINWAENSKFLKVEIDVTNGTNYITVGSSQLLAVPYAMYAGAVAGYGASGINGQLNQLYLYGTFNSFNPATAIQMTDNGYAFYGFKYLTAGTQLKFITALNSTSAYGNSGGNVLGLNGSSFNVNSNGIYSIFAEGYTNDENVFQYHVNVYSIAVKVSPNFNSSEIPMTYNAGTGILSCTLNVPAGTDPEFRKFGFRIGQDAYGDNLANGMIDPGYEYINLPSAGNNFLITLNLNFTGDGSPYTVTPQ